MVCESFASRVKLLRKEMKLTQDNLAEDLGVTKGTISVWERGVRIPEQSTINNLAEYFDVAVSYIMGFTDARQVYIEDSEQGSWKKSNRIDAVQVLSEMLVQLSDSSLSIVGSAIEEAYKQDQMSSTLGNKDEFFVKIDSLAIVESDAQLKSIKSNN